MADINSAAGGGIHPGKPVIWPGGKGAPVTGPGSTAQPGGVRPSVGPTPPVAPTRPGEVAAPAAPAAPATPAAPAGPPVRPLTVQDIISHLITLQIQPSKINIQLASTMLKYGLEISRENITQLINMLDRAGVTPNVQETAVALLVKGKTDSPTAMKVLDDFLSQNPKLMQQLLSLQQGLTGLQDAILANRSLLSAALVSRLGALVQQFDTTLQDLARRYLVSRDPKNPAFGRGELLNDVRGLAALLDGLQELRQSKTGSEAVNATLQQLEGALRNLVAQAILSRPAERGDMEAMNYAYWQIPNSLTKPPSTVDLIIKRDGSEPNAAINPENTRIVMSLETNNLGKLSVDMWIKNKDVRFTFNTQTEAARALISRESNDLRKRVSDKQYNTTALQVRVNPIMIPIRAYLIPLGIEDLLRIDTQV